MGYDKARTEAVMHEFITTIGEDLDRERFCGTPTHVAKAWKETLNGLNEDSHDYLCTQFEAGTDKLVLVRDIVLHSVCGHHLLPFHGHVHIGYTPHGDRVTGSSKLARAIEGCSYRPQIQERFTVQIADATDEVLHPQGIIVVIGTEHVRVSMRDISKPDSPTVTSTLREIMNDGATRAEMMSLVLGS